MGKTKEEKMKRVILKRMFLPIAVIMLAVLLAVPMLLASPLVHLNPDFEAFPRVGDAPLEVRFENWVSGGVRPYVKAEWDFDCDEVIETTLTGTDAEVMADVTWTYPLPGLYTVCLTMTDSFPPPSGPIVHTETKIWYITVLFDPWVYDTNEDGTVEKSEVILAVQHYFDGRITKAQVIEVAMLYFE